MSDLILTSEASLGIPERKPMGVMVRCVVLPGLRRNQRLFSRRKDQESCFILPIERLLLIKKKVW